MNFIVTTTINVPTILPKYISDFKNHGHDYHIIVIGDQKSPYNTSDFCRKLPHTTYFDITAQQKEFGHLSFFKHIPLNCIQRRNFGYLFFLKRGVRPNDVVITIDDDNFLKDNNYIGLHTQALSSTTETITATNPTWYNPLEHFFSEPIFHRGFSVFHRQPNSAEGITVSTSNQPLAVNAGLWEENPDVDAITRLDGLSGDYKVIRTSPLILGPNIRSPFNTQNTAYFNNFWLTAYLPPSVGRYDDIFSSYITKRIADHLGYSVRYGQPIVIQKRNKHNIYKDFQQEVQGMATCDSFVKFLDNIPLVSNNILDCYLRIADALQRKYQSFELDWNQCGATDTWSMDTFAAGMKLWTEAINSFNGSYVSAPAQPAHSS